MSAGKVYVGGAVDTITAGSKTESYTGVVIVDENENVVGRAGNDSGSIMKITNPYGSNAMAAENLAALSGVSYQPVSVGGGIIQPTAELGDGVTAKGTYSGIYSKSTTYDGLVKSDVSSGTEYEVDHEYAYNQKSKYATYSGLLNGTTEVNGAGLTPTSVTANKTEEYITGGLDAGYTSESTIQNWCSGARSLYVPTIGGETVMVGEYKLHIGSLVGPGNRYEVYAEYYGGQ